MATIERDPIGGEEAEQAPDFKEYARQFPEYILIKYQKMYEKTQIARRIFKIPETERVIQDYRSTMKKENVSATGRMYITQNYILFASKDEQITETIAFYRVAAINYEKRWYKFPAVSIDVDTGKVLFSMYREETYHILNHLFLYQPTYVHLKENQLLSHLDRDDSSSGKKEQKGGGGGGAAGKANEVKSDNFGGRWGQLADDMGPSADDYEAVDLQAGDRALELANQIRQTGGETLDRLKEQAETIDRVDYNMAENKNYLDRGDRILDGVSSVGGQIKNLVTPDLYRNKIKAFQHTDRTVELESREDFTDVPVLVKHPNDSLEPALMRFGDRRFLCVGENRQEMKGYLYGYDQVAVIAIRARPQHVDVRFHDGTPRFRCCTSFVQAVVNELVLRTKPGQVTVTHEPGTKQFQYGSIAIREHTMQGSRETSWSSGGGFFKAAKANYANMITEAPEEVRDQVKEQDKQIRKLATVVDDVTAIVNAMDKELVRENQQLERMNQVANKSIEKANKNVFNAARNL